jgi:ABC-type polysaccharide/polyol phosphate export permease
VTERSGLARRSDLVYMLAWREIKIRYKQSVMGVLWAVLMPTVIVLAGILVRYVFGMASGEPLTFADVASVSVKAVPWAFFVAAIRLSTTSLIGNVNLVTKIYLPREVFPLAAVIAQGPDFLVASGILALLLGLAGIGASWQLLWVPPVLAILFLLPVGLGLALSAAALFFRDVKYLVEVLLTFAIFFTPVFYDAALFGEYRDLALLNPVAPLLEALNAVVVRHEPPAAGWLGYSAAFAVVATVLGMRLFHRLDPYFAERI